MAANREALVDRLMTGPLLVVGDLVLDEYVSGRVQRVSPEAPIPVLRTETSEVRAGGAANVACNVASLGARVALAGTVGGDGQGERLLSLLSSAGVDVTTVTRDPARPTTHKTRMMAQGQQILRVDREDTAPLGPFVERAFITVLRRGLGKARAVIVSDYAKGTLTPSVAGEIVAHCRRRAIPLVVGLKARDCAMWSGATGAMLNRAELHDLAGRRGGAWLRRRLRLGFLAVTLGEDGVTLFTADGKRFTRRGSQREVFDVTGAGDTALAAFALAYASGLAPTDCAELANAAAGITVARLGTAAVTRSEVAAALCASAPAKLLTADALVALVERQRARGKRIVFTNGCYDVLHAGHVEALEFARSRGDLLIVAVNTDRSVRALKGVERPIVPEAQRVRVLAALGCVDAAVLFDEETPERLIARVRPDVLVKGADYRGKRVVGREVLAEYGGRVELAPLVDGLSTSSLIERIRGRAL